MTIKYADSESLSKTRPSRRKRSLNRVKIFLSLVLVFTLAATVAPIVGVSKPDEISKSNTYNDSTFQAGPTLTFKVEADARVEERKPTTNAGRSDFLAAVQTNRRSVESYIRFTVSGITDVIQTAHIRLYSTTDTSHDGPEVYATDNSWTETEINWNNRPARQGAPSDNKDVIKRYSWVEYDVTPLVTGDGTYSFVLVGDSNDAVRFSSHESSNGPQLLITFASGSPTSTPTPQPSATPTASPTPLDEAVLVGAGDIATCNREQDELTAQLLDKIPGTIIAVGDNAYRDGSPEEYANCYDPGWGRHKARTKPVPGNHEYHTPGAEGYFQYFNNIPPYYAYNLGSWRIYALNSEIDVSVSSPQIAWLQHDLAANPSQCVLAYWHRPRWSSATDSDHGSNPAMQVLWLALYNAGAEVVINGHQHSYERFAEMDASGNTISPGMREFVVGTGGAGLYDLGDPLPASEVRNNTVFGVLKLSLHPTSYEWEFIPVGNATFTDSGSGNCR